MYANLKIIFSVTFSTWVAGSAHAQAVRTGDAVICATLADARAYAATHKDKIQSAIDSETNAKACLVAKIAFVPGKVTERMQQKDATYMVTEILVVAVSTPFGYLSIYPSPAYTLLRLEEKRV
jgi:hypothetical protein